ncbi:MAG: hypothetical protein AAFQ64_15570 [Pseudomonadota bacterium]
MGLVKTTTVGILVGALSLSGCSVAEVRGKAPTTPNECEANWLQETGAVPADAIEQGTQADNVVASFFIALTRAFMDPHVAHARYRNCLESVGVTDVNGFLATDSTQARELGSTINNIVAYAPPKRPAHCPPGASVLYGGSGYCVGR